jgi:GT2 family glycosyltransferase
MPSDQWEIIVVDNNSTDATLEVIEKYRSQGMAIKLEKESRLGSNFCRNTGIKNSSAPLIAFIDDDAYPDSEWLSNIWRVYQSEEVWDFCLSGKVELHFLDERPSWLVKEFEDYLSAIDYGESSKWIQARQACSANLVIPRNHLKSSGFSGFDTRLLRKEGNLKSNDETLTLIQMEKLGVRFLYSPDVKVWHQIPRARTEQSFFKKRAFWQGVSDVQMEKLISGYVATLQQIILPTFILLLKNPVRHLRTILSKPINNRTYEASQTFLHLGRILGFLFEMS